MPLTAASRFDPSGPTRPCKHKQSVRTDSWITSNDRLLAKAYGSINIKNSGPSVKPAASFPPAVLSCRKHAHESITCRSW